MRNDVSFLTRGTLCRCQIFHCHCLFAVILAFAFALVAVFAPSFALAVAAAFAVPFALAFALALSLAFAFAVALAYLIHVHWICLSEVVHGSRLVRFQVGLNDRSQFVVVAFKLLAVHQRDGLAVSVAPHAVSR